jgi:histidyl-tRNA synthetase
MPRKAIKSVKGTRDILPDETGRWQLLEKKLHQHLNNYSYHEIRTPAFEHTELFARGVGQDTDIVSKEMYSWEDQGDTMLTLKPELTAPVVRAYIQHNLASTSPLTRLYYIDALFRRERPQKGRYRQFYQFGAEVLGSPYPEADVEIISIAYNFYKSLGLEDITLKLNSIGSNKSRKDYRAALQSFLKPKEKQLSEISRNRLESNPLRILDTKIPEEIELLNAAPRINDFLTADDQNHFSDVQSQLQNLGIPFVFDHRMVRGLDYYTHTTFEITSTDLGSQDALCGGGRYDNLVETLGGKATPAVGFAAGIERLLLALETVAGDTSVPRSLVYFIALGSDAQNICTKLAAELRKAGIATETDLLRRSLKAQMREADRSRAKFAVIIGEEEVTKQHGLVRDLSAGEQATITLNDITNHIAALLQ